MSNQITCYARRTLPTLLIFVLLAAPATLFARQPALAAPTFTVNSAADVIAGGDLTNGWCETPTDHNVCTLRAAIMKANHYPGGGVTINIPSGTYTLTIPASGSDDEMTGNLNITATTSIIGAGVATTIIDGYGSATKDNVLFVSTEGTVTISNVTIRNGRGNFGGGGGIFNAGGALTLTNSVVSGNNAKGPGGGIFSAGSTLTLTNSIVGGNNAGVPGAGGGIFVNGGTLALANSMISGNNASSGSGGGIYNNGGALTLTNSVVSGNSAGVPGAGGGIFVNGGTLTLANSMISGNNASGSGGGIHNHGLLNVINSTISGNNSATDGGGIDNSGASNLFNTTIAFNQADSDLNGTGTGGGVWNGGAFTFTNSIIALNSETLNIISIWVPQYGDCSGTITSQGFSILYTYDASHCTVNGSITLADPQLGPLQNNGGATQTHALLAGSPAIDAGDNTLGGCKDNVGATLTTDQRGAMRPVNGGIALRCDIGAYEVQRLLNLPLVMR